MAPKRRNASAYRIEATPWAGSASLVPESVFRSAVGVKDAWRTLKAAAEAAPDVATEVSRSRRLAALRKVLISACSGNGGTPRYPSMAFERWWYSTRAHSETTLAAGATDLDPVLPRHARRDDPTLVQDLTQVGFSQHEARSIARQLAVAAAKRTASPYPPLGQAPEVVVHDGGKGQDSKLKCPAFGVSFCLPAATLAKLKALHKAHARGACSSQFASAALVVALRYHSLGGTGFQLSLPASAFRVLESTFGVQAECFASPFNCWFGRYCSAFPDSDAPFGSLGSFLGFSPTRGSFEANPPFSPPVLASMREHMHQLLRGTSEPLSFIVAVAHWDHHEVKQLLASPFARGHILVPPDEQCWLDGTTVRRAAVELLVLALQNDAAASHAEFSATAEKLELLRQSCTGDAVPLGPRKKRARCDEGPAVVPTTSENGEHPLPATGAPAARGRRPHEFRAPHWHLGRLRRYNAIHKLRSAARKFAWSKHVVTGWHARNMRFWKKAAANVEGMTGGGVSDLDLPWSSDALEYLAQQYGGQRRRFGHALDVGAGIGRVALKVLRQRCDRVDLLEPVAKHLERAKAALGDDWPGRFFHSTLQDFKIPVGQSRYDLVWCQWIFMYITDDSVVAFFRYVASALLAPRAVLVVKENVAKKVHGSYFDDEEGDLWRGEGIRQGSAPMSVLRTAGHFMGLFQRAGLRLLWRRRQKFTSDELPMVLFALAAPET